MFLTLNHICPNIINSILHLLKVLLHPFVLAFIVAIDLAGYYLGITVHDHICSSCLLGEIQPCYQSFVLYLVIGCRENKTDRAFNHIPFRDVEYHTGSACWKIRLCGCSIGESLLPLSLPPR